MFAIFARDNRARLPNGLMVYGVSKKESQIVYSQIGEYFTNEFLDVRKNITVVDVGANCGLFSLEILRRTDGQAMLHSIEPAPTLYGHLVRNISEQFGDTPVKTYCCALSWHSGEATLHYRPHATAMSSLKEDVRFPGKNHVMAMVRDPCLPSAYRKAYPRWLERLPDAVIWYLLRMLGRRLRKSVPIRCQLKTLSEIIGEENIQRIDILKIDVEEAEWDVLSGISADDWPKIQSMAVEVHDIDGRLCKIRQLLDQHGFGRVSIDQEYVHKGTELYTVFAARTERSVDQH